MLIENDLYNIFMESKLFQNASIVISKATKDNGNLVHAAVSLMDVLKESYYLWKSNYDYKQNNTISEKRKTSKPETLNGFINKISAPSYKNVWALGEMKSINKAIFEYVQTQLGDKNISKLLVVKTISKDKKAPSKDIEGVNAETNKRDNDASSKRAMYYSLLKNFAEEHLTQIVGNSNQLYIMCHKKTEKDFEAKKKDFISMHPDFSEPLQTFKPKYK